MTLNSENLRLNHLQRSLEFFKFVFFLHPWFNLRKSFLTLLKVTELA